PADIDLPTMVRSQALAILGFAQNTAISPDQPLQELGLDSLMALELRNNLSASLGQKLPATLLFDYPTLKQLTAHLAGIAPAEAPTKTETGTREPLAIIGMACRFPGDANTPAAFWELLCEGRDAVTEVPPDRWDAHLLYDPDPATPGKSITRHGAFIKDIKSFDPAFFGITPREAAPMDPQQRLLLEVSWEALENAGLTNLYGTRSGFWLGICGSDYSRHHMFSGDWNRIDAYSGTGTVPCIAAGRVAYFLGLQGPAIAIDTACSSSFVATHLASQSLHEGETDIALVGGVSLMVSPESTIYFSKLNALSPDGRCKTFDASADGFGRGEGCGVVVLKRLSDAKRDKDPIIALIRGSATNQDGRSAGLTAPSGAAQQAVIGDALQGANVAARDVAYVEAHGTGTALGDPIELQALGAALGKDRQTPIIVGSVKTNIGHLEGAAGMASVIKTALALHHRAIPPSLHFNEPSPHIPWDSLDIEVPTSLRDWPAGPLVAGVSGFGLSGTNVHLLLEAADEAPPPPPSPGPHIAVLSARDNTALQSLSTSTAQFLESNPDLWPAAAATNVNRRSRFSHRLSIVAENAENAAALLRQGPPVVILDEGVPRPTVAFLFTGQGSQYRQMAKGLYDRFEVFREVFDRCAAVLPLKKVVFGDEEDIDDTTWTQPALYAIEVSLAELWRSFGVEPDAMLGHSIGEFAAAAIAGVFSIEDGLRLVATRGRLMSSLPRDGSMAAIFAPLAEVMSHVSPMGKTVSIGAVNGPREVVISGLTRDVETVVAQMKERGTKCRKLTVSHAFHSSLMEPILDEFASECSALKLQQPSVPLASNLTGKLETTALCDPLYWRDHIRQGVRFADGIAALDDIDLFIEIGPSPVLSALGRRCLPDKAVWIPSLRPKRDDATTFLNGIAQAHLHGIDVDFHQEGPAVQLPNYPFQRQEYWIEPLSTSTVPQADQSVLYTVEWVKSTAPADDTLRCWRVLGDNNDKVANELCNAGYDWDNEDFDAILDLRGDCQAALELLKELLARDQSTPPVLVCDNSPVQSQLWGLARTVAQEHPELGCRIIEWDGDAETLVKALDRPSEPEIRLEGGEILVPRLVAAAESPKPMSFTKEDVVLITGGLGALGLNIAEWLGGRGVGRIVLTSRRPPTAETEQRIGKIRGRRATEADSKHRFPVLESRPTEPGGPGVNREIGTEVVVVQGDVSQEGDVKSIIDECGPSLSGIVHAAGVNNDGLISEQSWSSFEEVFAAKVSGAWNIHQATEAMDLRFFVLFSSVAAVLGSAGQANYAAANSYLDALAHRRRQQGLRALSINWGPWAGGGMATALGQLGEAKLEAQGIAPLSPSSAAATFGALLNSEAAQIVAIDVRDWEQLASSLGSNTHILDSLTRAATTSPPKTKEDPTTLVRRLAQQVMGFPPDQSIDENQPLIELGLDSLMAVELRNRINAETGVSLPIALVIRGPSLTELKQHLKQDDEEQEAPPEEADALVAPESTALARYFFAALIGALIGAIAMYFGLG
ncbi:MAG: acyltransferase domain-containing protein, partial [Proteobacteria bacterium]|nr:acyltransferase domain-containing protein [Pseudomonadota bacterium]